jgi:hypothetical protein
MDHMIPANAAQNIGTVLCQELIIELVRAARLVFGFRRNEGQLLNEALGETLAVRPRKQPLNPWSGSWKTDKARFL